MKFTRRQALGLTVGAAVLTVTGFGSTAAFASAEDT